MNRYLEELQNKNSRFSLRAMAKKLNMNPGGLSLLLNGKRPFSDRMIEKICFELCLSPDQVEKIFYSDPQGEPARILQQSLFETLSNWVHDAFLSLIQVKGYRNDPNWICKKLGISRKELDRVVSNLKTIGLIELKGGRYVPTSQGTQVYATGNTTAALKKLQLEANVLSRIALEYEDIRRRYHGTNTLTIDPDKMEEAKKYIREFRKRFCVSHNSVDENSRVYQLNVSLYPIDKEVSS